MTVFVLTPLDSVRQHGNRTPAAQKRRRRVVDLGLEIAHLF
jgi:hypothetical protein